MPFLDDRPPPFYRLPIEIRLQIYSYLLTPPIDNDETNNPQFVTQKQYAPLPRTARSHQPPTLHIRTLEPRHFCTLTPSLPHKFLVRDFRGRSAFTSFALSPKPSLYPNILAVNRSLRAETAQVLYSSNVFDFGTCVEAIAPFFSSLQSETRELIKVVRITKRPQCYDKEFDRLAWDAAMEYLASMNLERLELVVIAGKPAIMPGVRGAVLGQEGDEIRPYDDEEWPGLMEAEGFEWVRGLVSVKGLREVRLEKLEGHSPPAVSKGLERWVRFSSSVESSFGRFCQKRMVGTLAT
ncbi:Nonribosomal peptide synthetase 2 [Elsinoe australis]|uniref:Nonribosomal peptide synthetase 2 n=1 Tax=Elsinoe australis TaxID=40998 RepID=A0A2P7Z7I9_9PEZI|nr:Nonribosomal peptide synthetase 2 [Elsinoe australis]